MNTTLSEQLRHSQWKQQCVVVSLNMGRQGINMLFRLAPWIKSTNNKLL